MREAYLRPCMVKTNKMQQQNNVMCAKTRREKRLTQPSRCRWTDREHRLVHVALGLMLLRMAGA